MKDLCLIMLPNPALANPKMYYSLGVLYLAAVAEKHKYSVEVADLRGGYKELPEAKFYGFSATTPEIPYAKKISRWVNGKTIIGGAHATLLPEDCLSCFDFTVFGVVEEAIVQILSGQNTYRLVV